MKKFLVLIMFLFLALQTAKSQFSDFDPNILWVSDSTVGRLDNIIVQPNGNIFGHDGETVKEIDGTNGKLIRTIQNITSYNRVADFDLSADGRYMVCSYVEVVIIDLTNKEKKVVARGGGAKFCKGSNKIAYYTIDAAAVGSDSSIVILDIATGKRDYIKTEEAISNIAFSSDGRFMATGGSFYDGVNPSYTSLKLWDAQNNKLLKVFESIQFNYETYKIEFSPDNKKVGFNYYWNNLYIYSTETYSKLNIYNEKNLNINVSGYTFITNELIGIQSEKTLLVSLTDNKIIELMEFPYRGPIMDVNSTKEVLYAGIGFPLIAWDLKKVLSSVTNEQKNLQLNTEYKDGVIVLSNLPELSSVPVIKILDLQGKTLTTITDLNTGTRSKLEVNINLPAGIYILQLTDGSKEYSSKFLVAE